MLSFRDHENLIHVLFQALPQAPIPGVRPQPKPRKDEDSEVDKEEEEEDKPEEKPEPKKRTQKGKCQEMRLKSLRECCNW